MRNTAQPRTGKRKKKRKKGLKQGYIKVPAAFLAAPITTPELLPKVDAAELIPEVEMIQVEMLGTVNMQIAPIRKTIITVPNERIPLPANQAICCKLALVPFWPTSSWYLLISEVIAYSCMSPTKYMIR